MIFRWIVGTAIGTALVLATSPLFVRSYVPRVRDASREALVLQPGSAYRWRSEGYATTRIGPMGMPGQLQTSPQTLEQIPLALWGDSQAEGVCVADDEKISAWASRLSQNRVLVLPMARSGDACNEWLHQIEAITTQSEPTVRGHVFLVTELSDWSMAPSDAEEARNEKENLASTVLPAALIQAGRNLVTDGQTSELRTLRFRPGPVKSSNSQPPDDPSNDFDRRASQLRVQLARLRSMTNDRCLFLYAPRVPAILHGEIQLEDPDERLFQIFRTVCDQHAFQVVDLRPAMSVSVSNGRWPRGFHNGQFGVGHYNRIGNEIIANELVRCVDNWDDSE